LVFTLGRTRRLKILLALIILTIILDYVTLSRLVFLNINLINIRKELNSVNSILRVVFLRRLAL
jgi:hypothetical protein